VVGVGHLQGEEDPLHEEDLWEEGGDHLPQEEGHHPEGGLPLQGEEVGLEEGQEAPPGAPEDHLPGHHEAGPVVLQGAGGIHHQAALIHPVKNQASTVLFCVLILHSLGG